MAEYRVAVVIKADSSSSASLSDGGGDEEILVVRESAPPTQGEEYLQYVDSDLWDLPFAPLKLVEDGAVVDELVIDGADSCSAIDLKKFDLRSAVDQAINQVGLFNVSNERWEYGKFFHEPDFGPDSPVCTLFILGKFKHGHKRLQDGEIEISKWIPSHSASLLLKEAKPGCDRIGPLFVTMFFSGSSEGKWKIPSALRFQEYPPGICILPMRSRTIKPFRTTNLLIVQSEAHKEIENSSYVTYGDALLVDPGCGSEFHSELADIVATLPRKLVIFVTHHHYDHIDGLSAIQKCSPDALLLAHENTMDRIEKDAWSSRYLKISDGHKIKIGQEELRVVFAPGHTDGHAALLHVSSNSLVVGDHCVGQGSAVLDYRSGGNMKDYFETTYKFMELSPHVMIPMHGRFTCWPKSLLCGYLKHRRAREQSVLDALESGAQTIFEILEKSYADVDSMFWLPASSNVRLHVDYLAHQGKLPQGFSLEKYLASFDGLLAEKKAA